MLLFLFDSADEALAIFAMLFEFVPVALPNYNLPIMPLDPAIADGLFS